ncbi:terpene synthase family protein [Catenuloplanes atrovinosus]|uniref:Terpene synthase n=1 Tax=Catenuloplanes atrovinosus TaxID=137266 RepID=A0AAE4CCJ6_9ACTN|nr:hypothetical protein [Catenuloplanes atrovinosus]MDR7278039.1 pentalenene synthase [Catenuloplanes atrovinosus]
MPQGVAFDIPYPSAAVAPPEIERAAAGTLGWARDLGLIRSGAAADRVAGWRLAELAARFNPAAHGDDLLLAAHLQCFLFLFDDQFDDAPAGPRAAAVAAARQLLALLHEPPGTPPPHAVPATLAWADVWARSCAGMSAAWRTRAAQDWAGYLAGVLVEAQPPALAPPATVTEHLALRRPTVGAYPVLDLAERVQGCELPDVAFHTPLLQRLRTLTADIAGLCNDVASVEVEERRGTRRNAVLILEDAGGHARADAVTETVRQAHALITELTGLERLVPDTAAAIGLDAAERAAVDRYIRVALHALIRGNYDWQRHTSRYDPAAPPVPSEDLV